MVIDVQLQPRMAQDCLYLGSKNELFSIQIVEERLLADPVACQDKGSLRLVPQRESKHASQFSDKAVGVGFVEMDDSFRIRASTKGM